VRRATVAPRHTFGIKADVKDNICYLDEQTVLYPAGHNVVIFNTEQKTQRFISGTEKTEGITAIAVSPNKKYVAVAERAPEGEKALVTVFDLHTLKRRKVLQAASADVMSKEFVCLSFSPDSKGLLTHGGAPDWTLVYWLWEKAKVGAVSKSSNAQNAVFECSFNPIDNTVVCVTGDGICRFLRITDQTLKPLPGAMGKREPQAYLCHAWLSEERVVVATDTGDLLLLEAGELKTALAASPADGASIDSIVAYSKGFVCGADGGMIYVFERSEDKEYYKRAKSFKIESNAVKIKNLAVSPSEEQLVCTLANCQAYVLPLSNTDILKSDEMNFELLSQAFHSLTVTGLDTCVRKPLVATCGTDKSVRIWNYLDKSTDLAKVFTEECYSVSFHPSGLHVLCGFSDKLRLMNLLMDDIRPYKEFAIKACRECRFSTGGQSFAAVNGNTIQIYSTYTCENIGNLRGHNGKVKSIYWTQDDSRLISAGMDGAVYEWQVKETKRTSENVLKSCAYTCAVCTADARSIFAVGSDHKLKEISDSNITREFDAACVINQIVLSHSGRMLFAGTELGTVRSYKYPLNGDFAEIQVHSAPITRLRITYDDAFLFTGSEDGTVYIFDVRDKEGRGAKRDKEMTAFAEEILVTKSDLEEKTQNMAELKTKVEELTMQNEYQLRLKDLNYNEKLKEATEKFTQELDSDKKNYELLLQAKNDMEMEYEEKIKQLEERHQQQLQAIEAQYQQKIMAEVERYQSLVGEKDLQGEKWEEKLAVQTEEHERAVQELTDEYEARLNEEAAVLEREKSEKEGYIQEFDETRRQLEEDVDREIEELKERYEAKLASERESALRLKGENGIMRKKFTALQKDIEDQKDEINGLFQNKKNLHEHIASLEKDIAGLKKEIRERDETIGDKEKRIYDLKKKNQELEKFKFVLDYKIKELKKQIEPREVEIMEMKEQIKDMDQELERYHKNNSSLELTISDLKLKLDGMQREILGQRSKLGDAASESRNMRTELHELVQFIQDPKALKEGVKKIYQRHVAEDTVSARGIEPDIATEYTRQREYLEKSVESLKRKLNKNMELHRNDNARMMQENVSLIKEINDLRREIKGMKLAQRAKDLAGSGSGSTLNVRGGEPTNMTEAVQEIGLQKEELRRLRTRIDELEAGSAVAMRAPSREQAAMEGVAALP